MAGAIWGPGLFISAWVIAGFITVGYSPLESHISDLAGVEARTRLLMTLGFAAFGVGVGISAWPLRRLIGTPAAIALGFSALFTLGVMLTPVDSSSNSDFLHGGFALLIYLTLAAAGPLAALTFRRRGLLSLSVVSLTVGLATVICLWASLGDSASGLFQRLGLTTTDIWLMAIGVAAVVGRLPAGQTVGQTV